MESKKVDYRKDPTHGSPKAPGSKYQTGRASTANISWGEVDGPTIKGAIDAITADGAAIIFSRTSDGGALSATLLDGKFKEKKYFVNAAEAVTHLQDWALAAKGIQTD